MQEAIRIVKKAGLQDIVDQKYKGDVLKRRLEELEFIQQALDQMTQRDWNRFLNQQSEDATVSQTALFLNQ